MKLKAPEQRCHLLSHSKLEAVLNEEINSLLDDSSYRMMIFLRIPRQRPMVIPANKASGRVTAQHYLTGGMLNKAMELLIQLS
jgi:hypothetical protein